MNKSALLFFILSLIGFKSYGQVPLIDSCAVKITVSCNDYDHNKNFVSRVLKFNEKGQLLEEIKYDQKDQKELIIDEVNQYEYHDFRVTKESRWERKYDSTAYKLTYKTYSYDEKSKTTSTKEYNEYDELILNATQTRIKVGNTETIDDSHSENYTENVYDNENRITRTRVLTKVYNRLIGEVVTKYEQNTKIISTTTYPKTDKNSKPKVRIEKYDDTKNLLIKTTDTGHSNFTYDNKGFLIKREYSSQKEGKERLSSDCFHQIEISKDNLTNEAIKRINSYFVY